MDVKIKVQERLAPLARAISTLPKPDVLVTHYRAGDTWARENVIPAGTVMIGSHYKKAHIITLSHGHLIIDIDGEKFDLVAPSTIVVKAGNQKAIVALEDSVLTGYFSSKKRAMMDVAEEYVDNPNAHLAMVGFCGTMEVD